MDQKGMFKTTRKGKYTDPCTMLAGLGMTNGLEGDDPAVVALSDSARAAWKPSNINIHGKFIAPLRTAKLINWVRKYTTGPTTDFRDTMRCSFGVSEPPIVSGSKPCVPLCSSG